MGPDTLGLATTAVALFLAPTSQAYRVASAARPAARPPRALSGRFPPAQVRRLKDWGWSVANPNVILLSRDDVGGSGGGDDGGGGGGEKRRAGPSRVLPHSYWSAAYEAPPAAAEQDRGRRVFDENPGLLDDAQRAGNTAMADRAGGVVMLPQSACVGTRGRPGREGARMGGGRG